MVVYSDKLFVLTPDGDLRILLDEGDPVKVEALERQFQANHVTEEVLFATGMPEWRRGWRALLFFGGADSRTAYIGSLGQRESHSLFSCAGGGSADGALERAVEV